MVHLALMVLTFAGGNGTHTRTFPRDSISTLRPGDRSVDGARIKPHTMKWRLTYQTPTGSPVSGGPRRVAAWYDSVRRERVDGRTVLHRRQVLRAPTDSVLEVIDNWVDPRTLAPIRTENRYPGNKLSRRDYHGTQVAGFDPDSTLPSGRKVVDVTLAEPVFDFFGGLYDLLLAALPLRAGYAIRMPTDDGSADAGSALQWTTITVVGRESIAVGDSSRPEAAWHVTTNRTAIGSFEFWIADRSRLMLKMWYIGPRGGRQVWDVA